jgi:phosphoglycerate dehydrogenase-like enzyme
LDGIRRLRGQRLGIVGAGRIGRQVGQRALSFGFQLLYHDPYVQDLPGLPASLVPLDALLEASDAVVLCAALTSSSRHLLDAGSLARLRPGAIVVNVARGGLVDEAALASALRSGRCAFAALDVREEEPPDPRSDPLAGLPNILLTPHVAASSQEARQDLHEGCAREILRLLERAGRL